MEVGDLLERRPMTRRDGLPGWELADRHGVVVARMAAKFQPPAGEIVTAVWRWELVLVEIEYVASAPLPS